MPKVSDDHIESRRRQILDAALTCFATRGFHQTTMQDICKEAQLSSGAVYRYFPSKEDIIKESCWIGLEQTSAVFESVKQIGDTLVALDELVDVFFGMLNAPESEQDVKISVQLWAEAVRDQVIRELEMGSRHVVLEYIRAIVSQAQMSGDFNTKLDCDGIARLFLATYEGAALQKGIDPELDLTEYAKALKSLYRGTLWTGAREYT